MMEARAATVRVGPATLLDRISIEVAAGELVVFVGPNGAGKSTLLGLLAGDRAPTSGEIYLGGDAARRLRPAALAGLRAVLPQSNHLTAAFTAEQVVMLGQTNGSRASQHRSRDRARRRLAQLDLGHAAGRLYPSLSGGEQKRVQFARVLEQLGDSGGRALLLDEPTAALDLRHQHLVLDLARRAANQGHAVAAALHDLSLAAQYADRVALLHRGRLAACGRPDEIIRPEVLEPVFEIALEVMPARSGPVVMALAPTSRS